MERNSTTNTKFGLPLDAPVTQTIIPVVSDFNFNVLGFFVIPSTEFDGTEETYTFDGITQPISITTVTPTNRQMNGRPYGQPQYMAAVYNWVDTRVNRPWLGYPPFVSAEESGYWSRTNMTTTGTFFNGGLGSLIGGLVVNLAPDVVDENAPTPDVTTPQTMKWYAPLDLDAFPADCRFFDFNWLSLFKAKLDPISPLNSAVDPLQVSVVSLPAGDYFALKPVTSAGPTSTASGIMYDTLRVLILSETVPADDYVFQLKVSNSENQSVNVQLTLTVS